LPTFDKHGFAFAAGASTRNDRIYERHKNKTTRSRLLRVKSKIAGEWEVQKADRLVKRINQERINQDEGGNKSRMRIVFGFRGALTTQTAMGEIQREKSGTWDLVSFDEKESQMELDCDLGSGDVRTSITFLDANTIKLVPPNMAGTRSKLTFERKK